MSSVKTTRILVFLSMALIGASSSTHAQTLSPNQQLAREIYQELVEINTVTPTSPWWNHVFLGNEICTGDSGDFDDG